MSLGKYGTLALCASNRRRIARKNPGMTMSPRPSRLSSIFPVIASGIIVRGKRILIGPSMLFATVTMTSVPLV